MKIISLLILLHIKIIKCYKYTVDKDYSLGSTDIENHLISSYVNINKFKCFGLCNTRKVCEQGVFTINDSTCYLLNSTASTTSYVYSASSLVFNKQVEIKLHATRLNDEITLTWDANEYRTFSRYIIKYTTDNWATTLTAPGSSFILFQVIPLSFSLNKKL